MSFIHADQPWCTVHYLGDEYGLLGGFHFSEAIEREISEVKQINPAKYAYASRATMMTQPTWRIDEERRLWLEEIRVVTLDPSSTVIKLPNHPYPIPSTWVESMRILASEEIISPNKTGKVTVRQEILTLWLEEGRVVEAKRTREEVRVIRLGKLY